MKIRKDDKYFGRLHLPKSFKVFWSVPLFTDLKGSDSLDLKRWVDSNRNNRWKGCDCHIFQPRVSWPETKLYYQSILHSYMYMSTCSHPQKIGWTRSGQHPDVTSSRSHLIGWCVDSNCTFASPVMKRTKIENKDLNIENIRMIYFDQI